jgi:two-component system nitrogen regulation response regulator GlnG
MPKPGKILIVEDESSIRFVLSEFLTGKGFDVKTAENFESAKKALASEYYKMHFLDIRLPDGDGLDLLTQIKESGSAGPVIVMTAESTMNNAIRAVKRGAFEYIVKPFALEEIEEIIGRVFRRHAISPSSKTETPLAPRENTKYEIIGNSEPMQKLYKKIGKAAPSGFPALIIGDSGVGKELVARNLHEFSDRSDRPFIAVNCSAIPKELFESELFGYVRGAFTGADRNTPGFIQEADGGTLFMDEIGDAPKKIQPKLLRFLEDRKVAQLGSRVYKDIDVRFIAATNKNLKKMVENKDFREDLYHRLNVISLKIPTLKERQEDIPLLARNFVKIFGGGKKISDEAILELQRRSWSGNVRQLLNTIKRAIVMSGDDVLVPESFTPADEEPPQEFDIWIAKHIARGGEKIYERVVGEVEGELIRQALDRVGGNKVKAAKLLGINRNTLSKKLGR